MSAAPAPGGALMNVGFALLVDQPTHNFMRKLAVELDRAYCIGLHAAQPPAHVSLKQPFHAKDLQAVESYFDTFAASIQPFEVAFDTLEVQPATGPTTTSGSSGWPRAKSHRCAICTTGSILSLGHVSRTARRSSTARPFVSTRPSRWAGSRPISTRRSRRRTAGMIWGSSVR